MIKKLLLCTIILPALCLAKSKPSQNQLTPALREVEKALVKYQLKAPRQDYTLLLEYMRYYRSWYQAVTPAPADLYKKLSIPSQRFIKHMQRLAEPFTRPAISRPGASRLTVQGEQFYQAVLAKIQERFFAPHTLNLDEPEIRIV